MLAAFLVVRSFQVFLDVPNQSAFVVRDIEKFVNSLDNIQMKKLFLGR